MVIFGLSVRLSWYPMRRCVLLHVWMLRECYSDGNAGVGTGIDVIAGCEYMGEQVLCLLPTTC